MLSSLLHLFKESLTKCTLQSQKIIAFSLLYPGNFGVSQIHSVIFLSNKLSKIYIHLGNKTTKAPIIH